MNVFRFTFALCSIVLASRFQSHERKNPNEDRGYLPDCFDRSMPNLASCYHRFQRPFLAVFGASWCKPCVELEPKLSLIQGRWGHRIDIVKMRFPPLSDRVDPTSLSSAIGYYTNRYGIETLPAAILFVGGELFGRSQDGIVRGKFKGEKTLGRVVPKGGENIEVFQRAIENLLQKAAPISET